MEKQYNKETVAALTKAEMALLYATFIVSDPDDDKVKEFNEIILSKWSNRELADIKDRAWKILKTLTNLSL